MKTVVYPKPGQTGGVLIRQVIGLLRKSDVQLGSHILIAISGGVDSVALAHLLIHYGRKIATRAQIRLLHINHGWRGAESESDARWVQELAAQWEIPLDLVSVPKGTPRTEDAARQARKRIYARLSKKYGAMVFTAHHADDVAETLIWRLFTGAASTHGGGILVQTGVEIRPFLAIRKRTLQHYLKEEGQVWREDRTNWEGENLRSRMRNELMPALEKLFPKGVQHLVDAAFSAQREESPSLLVEEKLVHQVFSATGLRLRRTHWEEIQKQARKSAQNSRKKGSISLPGGWILTRK